MISFVITIVGMLLSMFLVGFASTFVFYLDEDIDWVERVSLGFGLSLVIVILTGFLLGANDQVAGFWQLITGVKGMSKLNVWLILSVLTLLFVLLALYRRNKLRLSEFARWFRGFYKRKLSREILLEFVKRIKTNLLLIVSVAFAILIKAYPLYHFNNFAEGETAKAIFWAKHIMASNIIPDYSITLKLHYFAADFNTPGLHFFVASTCLLSNLPLVSIIGIITVFEAIAVSLLIYTIADKMTGNKTVSVLALFFSSLTLPLLRYTNLPGYAFQNLFGEILIFLIIYLFLHILDGKSVEITIPLLGLSLFSLLTVHKLSTYVMVFILFACLFPVIIIKRKETGGLIKRHFWVIIASLALTLFLIFYTLLTVMWPTLDEFLNKNVGRIVLTLPYTSPSFTDYFWTFGIYYILLSFLSVLICVKDLIWAREKRFNYAFLLAWLLAVLVLSQGPRIHINIEPWRAMHYLSAPLAILISIGTYTIFVDFLKRVHALISSKTALKAHKPAFVKCLSTSVLLTILFATCFSISMTVLEARVSLIRAFDHAESSPRAAMSDSEISMILDWIENNVHMTDQILIDYWASSKLEWMYASSRLVSQRLGTFIDVYQHQYISEPYNPERRVFYENVLNFEKIFMMGNSKIAAYLFEEYNFTYLITGRLEGETETVFSNNTYFSQVLKTDSYIIYKFDSANSSIIEVNEMMLLNADTLANDLGDLNDFMTESEAVVDPPSRWKEIYLEGATARMSTDSPIYLEFNLGPYVNDIWDKNADGVPDGNLTLLIRLYDNDVQSNIYARRRGEWSYGVIPSAITGNNTQSWKVRKFIVENRSVWIDQGRLSIMLQVDTSRDPFIVDWIALGFEESALE